MQPPQNPYEQPSQPPSYPPTYGQPNPYQQGYQRGYSQATAGAMDILMGVLLILMSLGGLIFGGIMLLGAGVAANGTAQTNTAFANLPSWFAGAAAAVGGIMLVWSILMFVCSIGIFRFKKWAMITTGIQALISTAFFGYGLVSLFQVGHTTGTLVTQIVFVAISLLFTIYGFARAGAAN